MEISLTYEGEVKNGVMSLKGKNTGERMRKEICKAYEGKKFILTVKRKKKTRSTEQNAYYWAVVLNILTHFFQEENKDILITPQLVHEWCKEKFLPIVTPEAVQVIKAPGGEVKEVKLTTTMLSTVQFMDYITLIQQWATEFGQIYIPDPNEWQFESVESFDIDKE
jgi:hypothetical protein